MAKLTAAPRKPSGYGAERCTYAALRRKTAYIAAWWLADSQIGHLPVLLALGSLVPIEEAADSEMVRLGESGGLSQPVVVSLKPSSLLQAADHTGFFRLRAPRASRKRRQTSAEAAHPLGEPTGTLQPKDESVIVGYYTLQKCRSPTLPLSVNLKERKHQWQEMME